MVHIKSLLIKKKLEMWSHEVYEVTKSVCFVSCLCPSGSTSEDALRDEMPVMTLSASLSNHPYSNTVNLLRGRPWWQRWRAHVGATAWLFNMPDNLAECPGCHRGGQMLTSPQTKMTPIPNMILGWWSSQPRWLLFQIRVYLLYL